MTSSTSAAIQRPISTSAWYVSSPPSPTASQATLHCDGTPVGSDIGYRVNGAVDPVSPVIPLWTSGQDITFDEQTYSSLRGYNDWSNIDLRQVGATGGELRRWRPSFRLDRRCLLSTSPLGAPWPWALGAP